MMTDGERTANRQFCSRPIFHLLLIAAYVYDSDDRQHRCNFIRCCCYFKHRDTKVNISESRMSSFISFVVTLSWLSCLSSSPTSISKMQLRVATILQGPFAAVSVVSHSSNAAGYVYFLAIIRLGESMLLVILSMDLLRLIAVLLSEGSSWGKLHWNF